jgi:GWxTD domain-containing protein
MKQCFHSLDISFFLKHTGVFLVFFALIFPPELAAQNLLSLQDAHPKETEQKYLDQAELYTENGDHERALELLEKALDDINRPGFAFASAYLNLVVKLNEKDLFEQATNLFMMSLSNDQFSDADRQILQNELEYLSHIADEREFISLNPVQQKNTGEAANTVRKIWTSLDPTPTINTNQRLIEHRKRVLEAKERFANPDAPHGLDDRGIAFLKYGEPDTIYDRSFDFNRGELMGFVSEFQAMREEMNLTAEMSSFSNIETTEDADSISDVTASGLNLNTASSPDDNSAMGIARLTDNLIEAIAQDPFQTSLHIWIYDRFNNEMDENLVLFFSEGNSNIFQQIRSLDDWIPRSLYSSSRFNADFTAALPLQYLSYQRLMHLDRQFMDAYNDLQNRIFNQSLERSSSELLNMARNVRANHQQVAMRRQMSAPSEHSTEKEKIPEIPLSIHQYRSWNENSEPVYITFLESRPAMIFLDDFTRNQDFIVEEDEDTEMILNEIVQWYRFEQGVELYNSGMEPKGRVRGRPEMHLDSERDLPSVVILDIPIIEEGAHQSFYAMLFNHHPDAEPLEESIFPGELRGLGKQTVLQHKHPEAGKRGILMGDLITGYNRLEEESTRFPFVVSHDRIIPADENPVIRFEVHRLEKDESGFANFEVDYNFETEQRSFLFFRRSNDDLSGTIEFSAAESSFSDSIEFDNLPLRPGSYTLHWKVTDNVGGSISETSLDIEVIEPN